MSPQTRSRSRTRAAWRSLQHLALGCILLAQADGLYGGAIEPAPGQILDPLGDTGEPAPGQVLDPLDERLRSPSTTLVPRQPLNPAPPAHEALPPQAPLPPTEPIRPD